MKDFQNVQPQDALFAEFEKDFGLSKQMQNKVVGGQECTEETNDACTEGDVGCCDTDSGCSSIAASGSGKRR